MFCEGDTVYVSNPNTVYEKVYGKRVHMSFFGKVLETAAYGEETCVIVRFPATPNGCEMEWAYEEGELSLAKDLKDLTLEEFSNRFGVSVLAEYLES